MGSNRIPKLALGGAVNSLALGAALLASTSSEAEAQASPSASRCEAKFIGQVVARFNDDGRTMTLERPFAFRDSSCQMWSVPARAIVDGASIPRALWTLIGGPFEGRYRAASVIHDWYCDQRSRSWSQVHRAFYEGMLAAGVGTSLANVLYAGVYVGGPRWNDVTVRNMRLVRTSAEGHWSSSIIGNTTPVEESRSTSRVVEPTYDLPPELKRQIEELAPQMDSPDDIEAFGASLRPERVQCPQGSVFEGGLCTRYIQAQPPSVSASEP